MNRHIATLTAAVTLALQGCANTPVGTVKGIAPPTNAQTAITDTKISTDFRDEGVKIVYNMSGELDRIEVVGIAPVWKGNYMLMAETDALEKLVKFTHGQTVTSERRIKIIGRSLERARDNALNRINNAENSLNFSAADLENEAPTMDGVTQESGQNNTSRRVADRVDATLVNTVSAITAQGRLMAVRKIRDDVKVDGTWYVAVYQWSPRDQGAAELMRNKMR